MYIFLFEIGMMCSFLSFFIVDFFDIFLSAQDWLDVKLSFTFTKWIGGMYFCLFRMAKTCSFGVLSSVVERSAHVFSKCFVYCYQW